MNKNSQTAPDDRAPEQIAKIGEAFRAAAREYREALKRDKPSQAKANPTPDFAYEARRRFLLEQAVEVQARAVAAIIALEVGDLRRMGADWRGAKHAMDVARSTYAAMLREQEAATPKEAADA